MGFFPQLSNVYPELQKLLESRANNTNAPWNGQDVYKGGVSGLSTWIRIVSTVDAGLVMESVHSPSTFEKTYGNSDKPGILGYELDMKTPVEIDGIGRGLRPSPILTNLSVDEKAEGGSRLCSFDIQCYTQEQVDKLAQYLLEPSFHVLVEFGWNVSDAWKQRIGGGGAIEPCDVVKYDNWSTIKKKRAESKFTYDAMLGIITGGGITFGDGETYNLSVQITGIGNVAEYMQTHRGASRTDTAKNNSGESFSPKTIAADVEDKQVGVALFKQMFNALPAAKRIPTVYNWFKSPYKALRTKNESVINKWAYEGNFVNFDEVVKEYLQKWLTKGTDIRTKGGEALEIPSNVPLFDEERFIRFEMACAILNAYPIDLSPHSSGGCGKTSRSFKINIRDTYIGGFPHMFSTDKSKLYIPNTTAPNFNLNKVLLKSTNIDDLEFIKFNDLNNTEYQSNLHPKVTELPSDERSKRNGSANDPATGQTRPVPYAFPCEYDLNSSVISYTCDDSVLPVIENKKYWGWLKDLYINFDFFCECLSKPNLVVRDVLYDMLNGMSGACNSMWKFQIQEKPITNDKDGGYELTVTDMNFLGKVNPYPDGMALFQARGTKSPFIKSDFSVDTPGAMMSSIVQKKMADGSLDGSNEGPRPLFGNVFSTDKIDRVGTILLAVKTTKEEKDKEKDKEPTGKVPGSDTDSKEDAKAKSYELFANRAGVFSKLQDREGKIDIADTMLDLKGSNDAVIEDLLIVGTWNDPAALKQIELIDKGLVKGVNFKSQTKKEAQKQNPPIGLATFNFDIHGASGFKVGDQFRVEGLPSKFGPPCFYQVVKVDQALSTEGWTTSVKGSLRTIGEESDE
jgi:hypothetical protein